MTDCSYQRVVQGGLLHLGGELLAGALPPVELRGTGIVLVNVLRVHSAP